MKKIKIGRISGAQGLHGEIKLFHDSGEEDAVRRLTSLFLRTGDTETAYRIEWLRIQKRTPVFKLEGIDDRNAAEALIGSNVYALEEESRPDGQDAWLVSDLIGLDVRFGGYEESGEAVGKIEGIIDNPAHDILEIGIGGDIRLLPFVDVFVTEIRPDKGYIQIIPPKGWRD